MTQLPFNARGHLLRVADGEMVEVTPVIAGIIDKPYCPVLEVSRCWLCGRYTDPVITDNAVTATPCPYPDGITVVTRLEVPSGSVIVSDDLRPVYDWDESEVGDYNAVAGQAQAIRAMAARGCAYGPVGNTSPTLYKTGEGTYVIATPAYDEDSDTEVRPKGWTERAWVCTDLWAYSIADYDDWKSRGGHARKVTETVVHTGPGTYEFTWHAGERGFNRDTEGPVIYADIRKVA
jgi:hypothetical protein